MRSSLRCAAIAGALCAAVAVAAQGACCAEPEAGASAKRSGPDPQQLADRIDHHIDAGCKAAGVATASQADDAEFFRRVSLDLTGRIPTSRDVYDFLADDAPDKRRRAIDDLLASPRHDVHFANTWRALLLAEADSNADARYFQTGFENWLRERRRAQVGYDRLVYELVTAPIGADTKTAQAVFQQADRPNPWAFYAVKEAQPENLASTTSRLFLGIQIECAQCHSHPFAVWSQQQFWSQAAFFAGIERQGTAVFAPLTETVDRRELAPPDMKTKITPIFLDDRAPTFEPGLSSRVALARWITAPNNPFFARAAVNRVWAQLMGIGIVDPVDDFHDDHPPSHPELLDELALGFVAADFDLGYLYRAIALSRTYQRTSAVRIAPSRKTEASAATTAIDPRLFARMPVKRLSAEQFFDSLALTVGYREPGNRDSFARNRNSARERFLAQFAPQGTMSRPETSILQALTLMNGKFTADAVSMDQGHTLSAVVELPGLSTAERIEAFYVATLGRRPTAEETKRLLTFVDDAPAEKSPERLADIFWMLLNSAEFRLNH